MVEVEADITQGLPSFTIIGLPDTALSNARERVRHATSNAGCPLPARRITVNLSPAALPKFGPVFDLAIAMALLAAARSVDPASIGGVVHLGELGLDGRLRPTDGILPAIAAAARLGHTRFMVPTGNADEARLVPGVTIIPVSSVRDAAIAHGGRFQPEPTEPILLPRDQASETPVLELADVVGNRDAAQSLVVAAAGGHHLFMLGPPGAGKTMLAARLPGLLPDLDPMASLEVTSLRSLAGQTVGSSLITRPPLESPHHTATAAALVGGGSRQIRPGAAARASHGVLFMDEAPEFNANVLDALRQPLESGVISIHRANAAADFPASFQLVLAANPCPCGQYGARDSECTCTPNTRRRYLGRISGPLMDRIDIQLRVQRITAAELRMSDDADRLTTVDARAQVVAARAKAAERLSDTPWRLNSQVPGAWFRTGNRRLSHTTTASLDRALERGGLTMRGYDRVLRLAWTVADLDSAEIPTPEHVGRALYLRKSIQQ
ncbi:YifB family Mg chelatase-like AAA ATPase [Agreia sp. COWG]|uniref:YifB family Mg chelatase-like AAA ATPase n=1 Tax=Agreia sp. COWG TaxID=2773266 RepID=UPI001F01F10B